MFISWSLEKGLSYSWQAASQLALHPLCSTRQTFKLESLHLARGGVGNKDNTLSETDLDELYSNACSTAPRGAQIVVQCTQKVQAFGELFYTPVQINNAVTLSGMMDSGSMACSISESAVEKLSAASVLPEKKQPAENVVLIGCGGLQTKPEGFYDLEMDLYGMRIIVPTLLVPGQHDDLILGSNFIKHIIHVMKGVDDYWEIASRQSSQLSPEIDHYLSIFTNVEHWRGGAVPDKVGTVRLT